MGKFNQVAAEIGALVTEKNAAYGDSFAKCGQFLRMLYPCGLSPAQYDDALAMVRIFDKQMRIATRKDAFGESPYREIAGYGILGAVQDLPRDISLPDPWDTSELDFTLPAITLVCTDKEAAVKYEEEREEWSITDKGSDEELIEAWDVLQAAITWWARSVTLEPATRCVKAAKAILTDYHSEGRDVMGAKRAMLRKNALRGYYLPTDCAAILGVGQ